MKLQAGEETLSVDRSAEYDMFDGLDPGAPAKSALAAPTSSQAQRADFRSM
jgi:hypothetical protein